MSTTVYMKILEQTPAKYDRGMRVLTLGRIDRIKREIASHCTAPGDCVLEIGCGSGSLAALMTDRGAKVLGIDIANDMLAVARKSAPKAEFAHMTAIEIDRLEAGRFDRIVATLVFSELCEDEQDFVLRTSLGLLRHGGTLVVADEMRPSLWWQQILFYLIRLPLAALTFIVTQNTTRAVRHFDRRLARAGYQVQSCQRHLFGSLELIVAEKK